MIKGIEPVAPRLNVSSVHKIDILHEKAPQLVEALVGEEPSKQGFSLTESISMAAALENLISNDAMDLIPHAYRLQGLSGKGVVGEQSIVGLMAVFNFILTTGELDMEEQSFDS